MIRVPLARLHRLAALALAPAAAILLAEPSRAQVLASDWMRARILEGRMDHAMAYDAARERVVRFGGRDESYLEIQETWEWNGSIWLEMRTTTAPSARTDHALAYDAARGEIVLFGGFSSVTSGRSDETWTWNGMDWRLAAPRTVPLARSSHALAYDEARQRVVLFGGVDSTFASLGDTWEWDGVDWQLLQPATRPAPRYAHAMTYDPVHRTVLLFGGWSGAPSDETWEWNGIDWRQLSPATSPPARFVHNLASDTARNRVVLCGGFGGIVTPIVDTWEWDGANWTQAQPATPTPPRSYESMCYDAARRCVVLWGGSEAGSYRSLSDTWAWDGLDWRRVAEATNPLERSSPALAYDALRGRVVLFGGYSNLAGTAYADTWEWDGARWHGIVSATNPGARLGAAMAYDPARARILLFGGQDVNGVALGDTWEWDGASWNPLPTTIAPAPRSHAAIVSDTSRGRVVLFAGNDQNVSYLDTWEWDGTQWSLQPTSSTQPYGIYTGAFDTARGRCVFYGGGPETWEWDGLAWTPHVAQGSPTPHYGGRMAYDASRRRVIYFGGFRCTRGGCAFFAETWEWDGANWQVLQLAHAPEGRTGHALAYDARARRIVLFGGLQIQPLGTSRAFSDTEIFGALAPASIQSIGSGCTGSGRTPWLTSTNPEIGAPDLWIDLRHAPPAATCVLAFSPSSQALSLGGSCTLYLAAPIQTQLLVANAAGFATASYSIPFDPWLRGRAAFAQAFAVDPANAPLGLSLSQALRLNLGD